MLNLSVIIPVYNVEKYLRECLDSVLQQDFTGYEVLCVEDGSTDHSLDILEEYEEKYDNLKVLRHDGNKGLSAARNTGIKHAQGKYIQFVDSDDMINPGAFAQLYSCAEDNLADVVYFNMEFLNDESEHLVREKENNKSICGVKTGREMFCLYQQDGISKVEAVRQMIRRDFLMENQLFFYEGIIHEDNLFSFLVAMKAERVVDLDEQLYIYRQRSDSVMWSDKNRSAASLFVCIVNMCSYWISHDFTEDENNCIALYLGKLNEYYNFRKCYYDNSELLGGYKEKVIYNMLYGERHIGVTFDEQDLVALRDSRVNILYGAGKIGSEVLEVLEKHNISVNYIAVSNIKGNAHMMNGIQVKEIAELLDYRGGIVIIGTDMKWHSEIIETLGRYGFRDYVIPKKR